jgi:hypothetical protein
VLLFLTGGSGGSGTASSALARDIGPRDIGPRDIGVAGGTGEHAIVADAVAPPGQDREQETPDELVRRKRHRAMPCRPVAAVILAAEGDAARVESKQAAVCDGDAVGVAGETGEHRLRSGKGRLGVEEPVLPPQRRAMSSASPPIAQAIEIAEEGQPTRRVGVGGVGRAADKACRRPPVADLVVARLPGEAAHDHVLDHARP